MICRLPGAVCTPEPISDPTRGEGPKRLRLKEGAIEKARQLRRDRTPAEKRLWRALREAFPQAKFRFQVPLGPYHADFCSHGAKLVIEADGGQHADQTAHDEARTRFLNAEGYRVLRFWNNDILQNTEGVLRVVSETLSPSPFPHPQGERDMRS